MNNRIKVLHLTASLSVGGAERIILGLVEKMDRARFETHVCVLGKFDENSFLPQFERAGVPLCIIPVSHFYTPATLLGVLRYLRQHQFNVLNTHLTDADIVGRVAGWLTHTPVISTLHNAPLNYDNQRIDRRWLLRLTARFFPAHFVGVSEQISELFAAQWRIPEACISTIRNAVPLDDFLAVPEGTAVKGDDSPLTITNVASLTPQKAQRVLLEAARLVLARYPSTQFLLVGIGELEQELKAQAQALGIADRVQFTGLRRDIPALLGQTDVFVLSSFWEGLPVSAIEAMAAARAVVLTDVGGNRELFESGVGGLMVPPRDAAALAEALLALLEDESLRLAMGRAARQKAQDTFGFATVTGAYGALYQAIAAQNRSLAEAVGAAKEAE